MSAKKAKRNLSDIGITPPDNTIFHDMSTATTRYGKITFNNEFITLCAKAVAQYIKNNPKALEEMPMD